MRKLKEVLRFHSLRLSQHQIAHSCAVSQSTVHERATFQLRLEMYDAFNHTQFARRR
jgi:hypothetical protein